jgi:hypothetical protein
MGCSVIGWFVLPVFLRIVISMAERASDESLIDRNAGLSCCQAFGEERVGKAK